MLRIFDVKRRVIQENVDNVTVFQFAAHDSSCFDESWETVAVSHFPRGSSYYWKRVAGPEQRCCCVSVTMWILLCVFQSEDLCSPASRARCSTSHLGLPLVVGRGDLGTHPPSDSKVSYIVKLDWTHQDALTLSVVLTFSHTLSEVITEWIICNVRELYSSLVHEPDHQITIERVDHF